MNAADKNYAYEPFVIAEMNRRMKGHCYTCGDPLVEDWKSDLYEDMCFPCELAREWNLSATVMAYLAQAIRDRLEKLDPPRLPHVPPRKTY